MQNNNSNNQKESINQKDLDSIAVDAEINKSDSKAEIVNKIIETEKRKQLQEESEELSQEMHQQKAVSQTDQSQEAQVAEILEKSEFLLEIEKFLSENLGDVYKGLNNQDQINFKTKGEALARKIEQTASQNNLVLNKLTNWIRDWLKKLPGINQFFLEQETKIKVDKILKLVRANA